MSAAILICCECGASTPRTGRNQKRCPACRRLRDHDRQNSRDRSAEFQRLKSDPAKYAARKEKVNARRRAAKGMKPLRYVGELAAL